MLILIAEAKTMRTSEIPVTEYALKKNSPVYETMADEIMSALSNLTPTEIAETTRLSHTLAVKLKKFAYDFPYKSTGYSAIEAYTGVVFKALDYENLSDSARAECSNRVRIISSLYGWLRPDDIIKPYRLDFSTRLEEGPSDSKSMNNFWRADVTKALVRYLQENNCREILDLLPGDASKAVDWKLVKKFAKVWKADFVELTDGEKLRTPNAGTLKTMRGYLLRQILSENISRVSQLFEIMSDHYVCEGTPRYPDHLQFLC